MKNKLEYISNNKINSLIEYIHRYKNKYEIYKVNVHRVSIEYIFWPVNTLDKLKIRFLSIENILDRTYRLCVNLFEKTSYLIEVNKYQYKKLEKVIKQYWIESGEHWQDRGLY